MKLREDIPVVDPETVRTSDSRATFAFAAVSVAAAAVAAAAGISGGIFAAIPTNHNETVLG